MAIDYSLFTSLPGGYTVASSIPLDGRTFIENESQMHDIPMPYIGMMVYSAEEDKFFVVKSLADGYLVFATGETVKEKPSGTEGADYMIILKRKVEF